MKCFTNVISCSLHHQILLMLQLVISAVFSASKQNMNFFSIVELFIKENNMNFHIRSLPPVKNPSNSILIEQNFSNVDKVFKDLISIAKKLPRTKEIINHKHYWKGVCRSFFFRFPDDLEILQLQKVGINDDYSGIIQIKSTSRFGQSDFGVNRRRVGLILAQLDYF